MYNTVLIHDKGLQDYRQTWQAMRDFTDQRNAYTNDEIWLVEHPPVFTQGQAGKPMHIINPGSIPVVQTDRGGQVTYHGPGQLIAYTLINLKRLELNTRTLTKTLENCVIKTLASYGIAGELQLGAPGVYVNNAKIASLGLRVRNHCSYHGLSFNIDMDLSPFERINPCGISKLPITQLKTLAPNTTFAEAKQRLLKEMIQQFGYNDYHSLTHRAPTLA